MSMDALEFLRERKRMCNCYKDCCDCPLEADLCTCSSPMPDEDYKKIIATVEKWAEEHPRKTRQSVFLDQYPEAAIDADGVLKVCPTPISHAHRRHDGFCANPERKCPDCRKEFWTQEVE